jgi:EAL domain-containing protein (putative c-di-GMP-specific phosphodiesterase class I)
MLNNVRARRRAEAAALAGRPCANVLRSLTELQTYIRYTRGVNLVASGRVYCSSGLGPIDVPLSAYVPPVASHAVEQINLIPGTPFQPHEPVLAMFDVTGDRVGVLYVIEGEYVADALAHGVRYGAQKAALSIAGEGLLTDDGTFVPASEIPAAYRTQVASNAWPFAVALSSSEAFIAQTRWKYRLLFGAFGILLDTLIAVSYLLVFAPRRLLLNAVRRGLKQDEFHVVYQPIVDVNTRETIGVEALLRWEHPKWGPVSPAVFMGEVETSPLLPEVTGFVLRKAVSEMGHEMGRERGHQMARDSGAQPLRIAVNIAPRDLERKDFVAEVLALASGLPESVVLVLELTERFLLRESAQTAAVFDTLKAHGVKFAIDDFGTHHSNLDRLSRFPFDFVKIDRQFVNDVDTGGAELIKGIVSVAKHFGLQIVAEGVETESQHAALRAAGVPFGQGYLYQRPVRAEQLASHFRKTA